MYLNNIKKNFFREHIWLFFLIAIFLISFISLLVVNFRTERYILYFPDSVEGNIVGEYRILPRERDKADRIEQLVEEVILGPANILSYNIFQRTTSVKAVHTLTARSVVIDLDRQAMDRIIDRELTLQDSLDILLRTIKANFPGLNDVRLLIDGQEPFIPVYRDDNFS